MSKIDMKPTIIAKSDQLNADDLVSGPITVKITGVSTGSGADQPINIRYEGDDGKPWKPCKTMRRLMVSVWGDDGAKYVGQSVTLVRDPSVKWAGVEVGGIRISHMTGLDKQKTIVLQETKGKKKPVVVDPLTIKQPEPKQGGNPITDADYQNWTQKMDDALTEPTLKEIGVEISQVASSYDQASCDKVNTYYKDRMAEIRKK